MAQSKEAKLIYPPGVKELTEDISTDELYRRLKVCVKVLQTISQDDDNSMYEPLAYHIASEFFIEHRSKDIRRGAALCIADIFRIFAPQNPYLDQKHLKAVFNLLIQELKGLTSESGTNFTGSFYLLENLSLVKTFNLCQDLQKPEELIIPLFKQMFHIISVLDNDKVKRLTLNMLSPLIAEGDSVPYELLEFLLTQLIDENKSKCERTYSLAQDIIKQTSTTLEPYIQSNFINVMAGQLEESFIAKNLYNLIYELNLIIPSEMIVIVNNLETKLLSSCEEERMEVITLLSKLFSDKSSKMIEQNKSLWNSYISRYKDASTKVRCLHMKYSKYLLLNHPQSSKSALIECFMFNIVDPDERVRKQTCLTIFDSVPELYDILNPELWEKFKERALDKNYEIREIVLTCIGKLYQRWVEEGTPPELYDSSFKLDWIQNKILYRYYGDSVQDKQLVEKLFNKHLVPYKKPTEERMKWFYNLYCTIDENALKALAEMFKTRNVLHSTVNKLLGALDMDVEELRWYNVRKIATVLSGYFREPTKGSDIIIAYTKLLEKNAELKDLFSSIASANISCIEAAQRYKEIYHEVRKEETTGDLINYMSQVIARIVPIVDEDCVKHLLSIVDNSFQGNCVIEAELGLQNTYIKGFELLKMISILNPYFFQSEEIYKLLLSYLSVENEEATVPSLQILCNICGNLHDDFPAIYEELLPILHQFAEYGKPKQAKQSIYLLNKIIPECEREEFFKNLMKTLQNCLDLEVPNFKTALVSSGLIAQRWGHLFVNQEFDNMILFVVETVLMHDGDYPRGDSELWGSYDNLPDETKVKIEGMKCIARWLTGEEKSVDSMKTILKVFINYIESGGDTTGFGHNSPMENSWLRLSAACRILKLCHVPEYADLTPKQFEILAYVLNDPCQEVSEIFAKKLNKALFTFKLPLQFLAVFSISGLNKKKEFKSMVKNFLNQNILKRRQKLKERNVKQEDNLKYLPEYALPYAIYLLSHAPFFKDYTCISSLKMIRDCLHLFMECLISKNDNYSFSFFKRLLENIKQTKDKSEAENKEANLRMYAVCDLALNIVMSQKSFVLKDFPAKPFLNKKFFTNPDSTYSNIKTYLPPEFVQEKPVQSCFAIDLANDSNVIPSTSQLLNSVNGTQDVSRSDNESTRNLPNDDESTIVQKKKISKTSKTIIPNGDQSFSSEESEQTSVRLRQRRAGTVYASKKQTKKNLSKVSKSNGKSKSEMIPSDEDLSNDSTNSPSVISVNISDSNTINTLIKECNVSLSEDDIENYIRNLPSKLNSVSPIRPKYNKNNCELLKNNSIRTESSVQNSSSSKYRNTRKRAASVEKDSPAKTKKKKEIVPIERSLRSKASSSTVEETPTPKENSSSPCDSSNTSVQSIQSITSSIIKYAPKRSATASVIVQNSQNKIMRPETKSKIPPDLSNGSSEQSVVQSLEKRVTRSTAIKPSKAVNTNGKRISPRKATLKRKVKEIKSKKNGR